MASGGADRIEQDLTWDDVTAPMLDPDADRAMDDALLAYAHKKAAQTGAERFAAEWARREEEDERERERLELYRGNPASPFATLRPLPARDEGVVDAEVEANVVREAPAYLGLRPEPPAPVVQAPVAAEPQPEPEREPEPESEPEHESASEPVVAAPEPVAPAAAPESVVAAPESAPEPAAALLPAVLASMTPAVAQPAPTIEDAPLRHPTVPRPPAAEEEPEPQSRKERRRRKRELEETPTATQPMFTAGEWARMSPGARRLYGMENGPPS